MDEIAASMERAATAPLEPAWIEILSRPGDVVARHRIVGDCLFVGRGYDNDIVLDDPFVAARHLRILRDSQGRWVAEDLGSVNGLFADRGRQRQDRVALDDGGAVRIGHTALRLRTAGHPVTGERLLQGSGRIFAVVLALAAVVLGIEAVGLWLREVGEPKVSHYLMPLLTLPLIVIGWTTVWAIVSRIFAGETRFARHLLIATAGVLAFSLFDEISTVTAYGASWSAILRFEYIATWVVLAVVCFLHLHQVGRSHLALKAGLVGLLMASGIAIQSVNQFDGREFQPRPQARLLPPSMRVAPLKSEDAFLAEIAAVKTKLDRDRQERASGGIAGWFSDDEDED